MGVYLDSPQAFQTLSPPLVIIINYAVDLCHILVLDHVVNCYNKSMRWSAYEEEMFALTHKFRHFSHCQCGPDGVSWYEQVAGKKKTFTTGYRQREEERGQGPTVPCKGVSPVTQKLLTRSPFLKVYYPPHSASLGGKVTPGTLRNTSAPNCSSDFENATYTP